mmetsp:Transcript_30352/g.49409  ORF Transcript_30352/g.49409 Transcript_30352/m.49409 type:complete len:421 (-) Transcript_30352:358-1620(-)|eukprot:CAMPEP_0202693260 /NCGR_PEP_ID=MMETSP1385-20130828/7421_1 /ASSEMBLY_ACC=CAM_ASM_000861 /TAXON_ID=933848 /ORGANISM="Elphidium margaritaceum" /LENGTH=420 /DNA_ID=CAMNT_0049348915 /DNA_START=140 /DNA_END=1402 /DNA_ORIENTATION=+
MSVPANNDEEKKEPSKDVQAKIVIPEPEQADVAKLPKEVSEIYNCKAKYAINDDGSLTFYPSPNIEPSQEPLPTSVMELKVILEKNDCTQAVTYSDIEADRKVIQPRNVSSFITAAETAWDAHYPFRFRCEHIWLMILQSVAVHVDQNAEKLREKYVKHDGQKTLIVEISAEPSHEEWRGAVEDFVSQIDKNTVEDTAALLECDFSATKLTEKIAGKVTIMDICKNYFVYRNYTCCGFPRITLDGTKQDWLHLKQKTVRLLNEKVDKKFARQWGEALLPVLDRFIVAFDGQIDCLFWNSMIKTGATYGSGGYSWYSGWFNVFFPLVEKKWNGFCVPYSMKQDYISSTGRGKDQSAYTSGIAAAPVKWDRLGTMIDMKFLAGFVGFTQDPKSLEICPNIAWIVAMAMSEAELKKKVDRSWW